MPIHSYGSYNDKCPKRVDFEFPRNYQSFTVRCDLGARHDGEHHFPVYVVDDTVADGSVMHVAMRKAKAK